MQFHQALIYLRQVGDVAVAHQFEKVATVQKFLVPRGCIARFVHVALHDCAGDLTAGAAGQHNQPFAVLLKNLAVDARLVVEAFEVCLGDELDKVVVSALVVREHGHVIGRFVVGAALVAAVRGDVHLTADDGFDAMLIGNLIKVDCAVHAAVVGDGEAVHAEFFGAENEVFKTAETVEHAVLGVDMEMSEQGDITSVSQARLRTLCLREL